MAFTPTPAARPMGARRPSHAVIAVDARANTRSEVHPMQMTYDAMMAFAEAWIAAWNRRDVDAVLAHYADDAQFVSPVARNLVGRSVLHNKKELEAYWRAGLDRIAVLEFKLGHASWDERRRELNVVYEANLNGERKRACEIMRFDATGRQIRGEAFYGAVI
jgi:steroid delta-isomerase